MEGKRITNDSEYLANIVQNTVRVPVIEVKTADELNLQIQEDIRNTIESELNSEDTKIVGIVFADDTDDDFIEAINEEDDEEDDEDEEKEVAGEFDDCGGEEAHEEFHRTHHMGNDGEYVYNGNRY